MKKLEIIKRGKASPLSHRRKQRDVVIEYVIARSDDGIFVYIVGKQRLNGEEFQGGTFGKKYYSLSSLANRIRQMPGLLRRPACSTVLRDALPANNNIKGAIIAILRSEGVLISSPPSPENYAHQEVGRTSGYRSWRSPNYSIDDFLREMAEMDVLDTVEVAESLIWHSPSH